MKMRCVFSITTIASSTMIPRPNKRAKSTIKFSVTFPPTIKSAAGKNRNATNILSGTESATKNAFVTPIKNIRIKSTSMNPITMEFTKSLKERTGRAALIACYYHIKVGWQNSSFHFLKPLSLPHQKFELSFRPLFLRY